MNYDYYIVAFSGGKDSIACVLWLLEQGVPKDKIELWHHNVDGAGETFMDWEITEDYCRKFAEAFGLRIYFSWKVGGFKGEMLRNNQRTNMTAFEDENYQVQYAGGVRGKDSTRLLFPQITASLSQRWCSAYLKIDVCALAINNQQRFKGKRTVVLSGERAEESAARANYCEIEYDRTDSNSRHVMRLRPVHKYTEQGIWNLIEKYRVRVHPCYYLGFSRCSCKFCIFGNADQFFNACTISPGLAEELMHYDESFKMTMKRNTTIRNFIKDGVLYQSYTQELADLATSKNYTLEVIIPDHEEWILPAGAFGEGCGPQ